MAGDTFDVEPGAKVAGALQVGSDVSLIANEALSDNDVLTYDTADGKWHPTPNSAGSVTSVSVTPPIVNTGTSTAPVIGISAASGVAAGSMSSADFTKLAGIAVGATNTPLSVAAPQPIGTASAGSGTSASKDDHVHALPAVGPGAGAITYPSSITLDAQGRVIAASAGSAPPSLPLSIANGGLGNGTGDASGLNNIPSAQLTGTIAIARIPTGTSSSTVTIGNDTRLNPTPSGAGKMAYDTGSGYSALVAGTSGQVLHGGSAPAFSTIAATDISGALAASTYNASSTFSAANQVTLTGKNGFCVAVQGKYAYVTDLSAAVLSIADVSNPAAPVAIGAVTLAGQLRGLAIQGNYAYVCNNSGNLFYVVDISNPASPASIGSVAVTAPNGICVAGKYAYVFSENSTSSTVKVIDISNPASPTIVGSAAADNDVCSVIDVKGKYLYTCSSNAQTISVYNISTPTAPVRLNTPLNVAISAISVQASGRYLYAVDSTNKLVIVDVSNPTAPSLTSTLTLTHASGGIYLAGRYAFVADSSFSVCRIVDLQTPGSPTQIVTISTGASTSSVGVCVAGKYAYIAYTTNPDKLGVIDLGGIETSVVKAASVQTGRALITESLNVAGSVAINSGLSVGPSGIYCDGLMTSKSLNLGDGAVTQGTSVSTGVTLNASSGVITTFTQSAVAGATSTFTVTNSFCLSTSVVLVSVGNYAGTYGTNGFPLVTVSAVANGSFNITVVNAAPTNALAGVLKINFAIL